MKKGIFILYFIATIFSCWVTTAQESNFPHIKIWKALYRWPPPEDAVEECQWWVAHFDGGHCGYFYPYIGMIKYYNPDFMLLCYQFCHFVDCSNDSELNNLLTFCESNGYNYENCFLHYYDDTEIEAGDTTIFIPGWCGGSADSASQARIRAYIWASWYFLYNVAYEGLREYQADRIRQITETSYQPNPDYPPIYFDGLYYDCHNSSLYANNPNYGGTILEYMADKNGAKIPYMEDRIEMMRIIKQRSPNKVHLPNISVYADEWAFREALVTDGAFLEFKPNIRQTGQPENWDFTRQLVDSGKIVVIAPPAKKDSPEIPRGSYSTHHDRINIFYLADYYMQKERDLVYFSRCGGWDEPFSQSVWFPAMEYDVGQPIDGYYLWSSGTDPNGVEYAIYGRQYTKAWILLRPKAKWDYDDYGDGTGVTCNLNGVYCPLTSDGTLLTSTEQFTFRNAEAAILIPDSLVFIEEGSFKPDPVNHKLYILQEPTFVRFLNIPSDCTITIHSIIGQLIKKIDISDSNVAEWNLTSLDGSKIPCGIYLYTVKTDNSTDCKGKLVIIR